MKKTLMAVLATLLMMFTLLSTPAHAGTPSDKGTLLAGPDNGYTTAKPTIDWRYVVIPINVVIGGTDYLGAKETVAGWNWMNDSANIDSLVFHTGTSCNAHPNWYCIHLSYDPSLAAAGYGGQALLYSNDYCELRLAYSTTQQLYGGLVKHEVLHCLGMYHTSEPGCLMTYPYSSGTVYTTQALCADEKSELHYWYHL